jgi:hypothetical protein
MMRSHETGGGGKWTVDVRAIIQFVAAIALLAALAALLRYGTNNPTTWTLVEGKLQDTRVVPDHAREAPGGGELTWKAEYKVSYLVADHEYSVWTDSGIRGESEAAVRLSLPKSRLTCRVRYNSSKPEKSIADCR